MKTVAIYYRVSTHHQNTDSQAVELQRYCRQRNLTIFKEYSDITSGAKSERPSLNELLSDAKKRKFDTVIVFRFDRMARSSTHLLSVLNEFKNLNIDFISYNENIDTSTPKGQAMFTIIAANPDLVHEFSNKLEERANKDIQPFIYRRKTLSSRLTEVNNQATKLIELILINDGSSFLTQFKEALSDLEDQKKFLMSNISQLDEDLKFKREFKIDRSSVTKALSRFDLLIHKLAPNEKVKLFHELVDTIQIGLLPKNVKTNDENEKPYLRYQIRNKSLRVAVTLKSHHRISLNYSGSNQSSYQIKNGAPERFITCASRFGVLRTARDARI